MRRIIFISILFILLMGAALSWGYLEGYWRFNYPDKDDYPVRGIDVSHHQGAIDWDEVAQQDIQFVYMKATEGQAFKDRRFQRNWEESARVGLIRGAYHFFTFCKPGIQQAQNFISTVPVEDNTLPPAIDFEFGGNCASRPEKEAILKELREFVLELENAYGVAPIVYVTYPAYNRYLQGEIDQHLLWISDKLWTPELSDGRNWSFWQYANQGRVKGIKGPVDLNVFNGTQQVFTSLVVSQ